MEQIMQFFNQWWQFLALGGGAILLIVIVSAIVGRHGRKPVRRTAPKPIPEPVEQQPEDHEPTPVDEVPTPAADPMPTVEPIIVQPLSNPIVSKPADPIVIAVPKESVPVSPVPVRAAPPAPEPSPAPAPASIQVEVAVEPEALKPVKPKEPKPELGAYHVTYRAEDEKWLVIRVGSTKIQRTLETQTDAVNWATIKALTQNVELVVYKKDGTIKKPPTPPTKKAA